MSRIAKALEAAQKIDAAKKRIESQAPYDRPPVHREVYLPPAPTDPVLVTINAVASPAAEEYRRLKSKVLGLLKKDEGSNVLLVTSALAGEGKSSTSSNLAISIAQEFNHTVILVDADLRKPVIDMLFSVRAEKGLSEYLDGEATIEEIIFRTGVPKLTIIPGGGPNRSPVESLSSNRMRDLIRELKFRYPDRYIIIDTSPALLFAEAQALSAMVDRTILVVRERMCSAQEVKDAVSSLSGAPLLGVVYNDTEEPELGRAYGHYGRYRYGSSAPSSKKDA